MSSDLQRCQVLLAQPIDEIYDYAVPDDMHLSIGDYVSVPLGRRTVTGVVWGLDQSEGPKKIRLKTVLEKFDFPAMSGNARTFIEKVAAYNIIPKGSVLKMALPVPAVLKPAVAATGFRLKNNFSRDGNPKTERLADQLSNGKIKRASEIEDISPAYLKKMLNAGLIEKIEIYPAGPCANPDIDGSGKTLTGAQAECATKLCRAVSDGKFETYLLDGVTGSGKTETYFEAVAEALRAGRQVVILLPEIALSNAFMTRFKDRFGCAPALWHSSLAPAKRKTTLRSIATGKTRVTVGARSALFLPYPDLGLIIVDEEHDAAFKQEEQGIYNARDMAVLLGSVARIPVVLVSATPSLETMHNVWTGKYTHLELPSRYGGAAKPEIRIVDMRIEKPDRNHFLSPVLREALNANLLRGEQALLFLNRRGYAPLTICRTCGYRFECPRCTAWLVEHRNTLRLQCHHCAYEMKIPPACPSCEDTDSFAACGPGVERIAEEVGEYFPAARSLILASDVTDSPEKISAALDAIYRHDVDIIIGTQIIAKGHHFPKLTLVGIVDADLGLSGGDLRATEKSFHLLHQVAGRAGREALKGYVYIQSWNPDHRVMQTLAADDRDRFFAVEAEERQRAHMPPYTRLAGLIIASEDESMARTYARDIARQAPQAEGISILGPAQAQMYKIRGRYRYRILVRAEKNLNIQKFLQKWIDPIKIPSSVRLSIDIDPQSFL